MSEYQYYEFAVIVEGCTLTSTRAAFERDRERFLVPHGKHRALLQRLVPAGLWSE